MDPSRYKTVKTKRGFVYNYYSSPSQQDKPVLLFLHGYPSTSSEWTTYVAFFEKRGYGAIVPDLLGFGKTDKPTDAKFYVGSGVVNDVVDILDVEHVDKVVIIAHDWGVRVESRFATYRPERVLAYAFVCIPYVPRKTHSNYTNAVAQSINVLGYDNYGYWLFFSGDADLNIRTHIDSYINLLFPLDPKIWVTKLAPVGTLQRALAEDFRTPLPPYITKEFIDEWKGNFLEGGFTAPNQWYTVLVSGYEAIDENATAIPLEQEFPPKSAPIFFAAAEQDYVCVPKLVNQIWDLPEFKDHKITKKTYAADHWVVFSEAEQLSTDLEKWLGQVAVNRD